MPQRSLSAGRWMKVGGWRTLDWQTSEIVGDYDDIIIINWGGVQMCCSNGNCRELAFFGLMSVGAEMSLWGGASSSMWLGFLLLDWAFGSFLLCLSCSRFLRPCIFEPLPDSFGCFDCCLSNRSTSEMPLIVTSLHLSPGWSFSALTNS